MTCVRPLWRVRTNHDECRPVLTLLDTWLAPSSEAGLESIVPCPHATSSSRIQEVAQTGEFRKRNSRKRPVEASATVSERVVSWDRPWEPSPERKAQEREWESRRLERLDVDLVDTAQDLVDLKQRADLEAEKVAHMQRLLDRKRDLLAEIARTQRSRTEAEKATRAAERRLEFERRRAERLGQRPTGPRDGRPVRVEVDDEAWSVLQKEVVAQGTYLICRIGELVRFELDRLAAGEVSGRPSARRRRGPGAGEPAPRQRFLRIQVDDDTWSAFRLAAMDIGVSASRYLGEIAESEAHRLCWRAQDG